MVPVQRDAIHFWAGTMDGPQTQAIAEEERIRVQASDLDFDGLRSGRPRLDNVQLGSVGRCRR